MPLTPREMQSLIDRASLALQAIQDDLGRDGPGGRVRFPTGYIKTVADRTARLTWIGDEALKRNICYHLIFADVLRWLLNRTTLRLIARDMVIKHTIAVMGAVVEGITVAAVGRLRQPAGNRFPARLGRLVTAGAINEDLRADLQWLWDLRTNIHIHEAQGLEIDRYPVSDSNRAVRVVRRLADQLNAFFE